MKRYPLYFSLCVVLAACRYETTPAPATLPQKTASKPEEPLPPRAEVHIADARILMRRAFPIQVNLFVTGRLRNACGGIEDITLEHSGNVFQIRLLPPAGPKLECAGKEQPFEELIPLPFEGLQAGLYTIKLHNRSLRFELDVDNKP